MSIRSYEFDSRTNRKLLSGVPIAIGSSISDSDSDDDSSNLSSITNVGFSLSGKVSRCERDEQGSSPGVNQKNNEQGARNVEQRNMKKSRIKTKKMRFGVSVT